MSRIILTRKLDLKSLKYFCSQLSEFTSFEEPHLFSTAISKSAEKNAFKRTSETVLDKSKRVS